MKRILVLFVFLLCFSCVTCYATETPTISLIQEATEVKEQISVNVQISEDSMACGGKIDITYDETLLKVETSHVGSVLSNSSCMVNPDYGQNCVRISWAGTDELTEAGILCNVRFSVLSDNSFSTAIEIKQAKLANMNSEPISVKIESCSVEYTKKSTDSFTEHSSQLSGNSSGFKPSNTDNTSKEKEDNTTATPLLFTDVKENDWFYESVKYAYENSLMKGVSETVFAPDNTLTRAMLVTILYRNAGEPAVNKSVLFGDVDTSAYYANAVAWAKENGIVNGVSENEFAPNANITREQIAAIMYRYAQFRGYDVSVGDDANILSYSDAASISGYAENAMKYAIARGFINGKTAATLNPLDNATRAEIATIIMRFLEANQRMLS